MIDIHDQDGFICGLDRRLANLLEDGPCWQVAELLTLLIERANLTEADLHECSILDSDETIAPNP